MEKNNRKRSRKLKLVPREYLDSDDENIAQMQNEIEETIALISSQKILKKLDTNTSLQFSVKIEVEDLNEVKDEDSVDNQNLSQDQNQSRNKIISKVPNKSQNIGNVQNETKNKGPIQSGTDNISQIQNKAKVQSGNQNKSTVQSGNQNKSIVQSGNPIIIKAPNKAQVQSGNQNKSIVQKGKPIIIKNSNKTLVQSGNQNKSVVESGNRNKSTVHSGNQIINKTQVQSGVQNKSVDKNEIHNKSIVQSGNPITIKVPNKVKVQSGNQNKSIVQSDNQNKSIVQDGNQNKSTVQSGNQIAENSNTKINSVIHSYQSTHVRDQVYKYYEIDAKELRAKFDIVSKKTTDEADKIIEIYIRNYFGKTQYDMAESNLDRILQLHLGKWQKWYSEKPELRGAPGMYICYVCDKGWWHFSEFRDHVKDHNYLNYGIELHIQEFRITAFQDKVKCKKVVFDTDCWKCGKQASVHQRSEYKCLGCLKALNTCSDLYLHEGSCVKYKNILGRAGIDTTMTYHCPVCPYRHCIQHVVQKHILFAHSVRSDVPIYSVTSVCQKCNHRYNDFDLHECPEQPIVEKLNSCQFCGMHFQLDAMLKLHFVHSKEKVNCRICGMQLLRSCMEAEHLLIHTNHYVIMFRCILCTDSIYFLDFSSFTAHRKNVHLNVLAKAPFFEKVIVPKDLLQILKPIEARADATESDSTKKNPQKITNLKRKVNDLNASKTLGKVCFEDELGIKITVIDKMTVQQMADDTENRNTNQETSSSNTETATEPHDVVENVRNKINDPLQIRETDDGYTDNTIVSGEDYDLSIIPKIEVKGELPEDIAELIIVDEELHMEELFSGDDFIVEDFVDVVTEEPVIDLVPKRNVESNDMVNMEIKEEAMSDDVDMEEAPPKRKGGKKKKREKGFGSLPKLNITKNTYTCSKCEKTMPTLRRYLQHFEFHNYKEWSCPKCFKQFYQDEDQALLSHVNSHIRGSFVMIHSIRNKKEVAESNYQCRKCKKILGFSDYFKHWESHLEIQKVVVQTKDYFINMDDKPLLKKMLGILQVPDRSRSAEVRNRRHCSICNKVFERNNDCKRHYIEHLLQDAYDEKEKRGCLVCQLCGRGYQKGDAYKRHMRDHARLPIYKCEICDKTFSDSSNFCKHKKVHNLSVLICDICKKKFSNKNCLIKHIKMHQETEPIVCKTCKKIFYTKSSFNKHLKRNRSRSKCVECSTYFTSLKDKWDHMWLKHKERKYEADCPLCKTSFRRFSDVKQHLREKHNEKQYLLYKTKLRPPSKMRRIKEVIIL